jgi:hypothetical protein
VLKGQELITSARVRNMISQQDGIKAAYFGFLDRYRALPGDYAAAKANIKDTTENGDGDGQIEESNGTNKEAILAWEHLSKAGFINGSYTYNSTQGDTTTPKNPYAGYLQLVYDGFYGTATSSTGSASKHNLKTGKQVPVNILAEVDRKIDDGNPHGGAFQVSGYDSVTIGNCAAAGTGTPPGPASWKVADEENNCGGASLF